MVSCIVSICVYLVVLRIVFANWRVAGAKAMRRSKTLSNESTVVAMAAPQSLPPVVVPRTCVARPATDNTPPTTQPDNEEHEDPHQPQTIMHDAAAVDEGGTKTASGTSNTPVKNSASPGHALELEGRMVRMEANLGRVEQQLEEVLGLLKPETTSVGRRSGASSRRSGSFPLRRIKSIDEELFDF